MNHKDYIADRRQYGSSGKRIGGGWMIVRWDGARQIYLDGIACYHTKAAALDVLREEHQRSDAARILGRKGGQARSEAKTKAVRENAKKGGWPKGRPRKSRE